MKREAGKCPLKNETKAVGKLLFSILIPHQFWITSLLHESVQKCGTFDQISQTLG